MKLASANEMFNQGEYDAAHAEFEDVLKLLDKDSPDKQEILNKRGYSVAD